MKTTEDFSKFMNFKVISFTCDGIEEMNEELVKRGMDADDVINITEDRNHDSWYEVFCKEKT